MKIAIMQPTFLPWLGYFKMIESVDYFILLDIVQFERRSWQSRNKIKLHNKEHFLSLSTQKAPQKTPLSEILIDSDERWKNKLLQSFHHAYSKCKHYEKYANLLKFALFSFQNLVALNSFLINSFCKDLGINTKLLFASHLKVNGKREALLLDICKSLGADIYLSPEGSKNYLEKEMARAIFAKENIKIEYFDSYTHPTYKQVGKGFLEYLSAVDYLVQNTPNKGGGDCIFI